ncbi:MAG: serine/threonine-protein kinase [Vulcanimicrobiota bacterium]
MASLEKLGPYTLEKELGSGATGTVYYGRKEGAGAPLAIKVLSSEYARDPEVVKRFRREAEIAYSLRHPHIIQVLDNGEVNGLHYIVMELGTGQDLQSLIKARQFPDWRRSTRLAVQILQALRFAHAQGVVHRDIKPANILLDQRGDVVVTDFGVAYMQDGTRLTSAGALIGTPEYMAPEAFDGGETDSRVDVYATSVLLYELLTHTHPFRGDSITNTLKSVMLNQYERPDTFNSEIPSALSDAVMLGMSRNREERPSANQLAQQLLDVLGETESCEMVSTTRATVLMASLPEVMEDGTRSALDVQFRRAGAETSQFLTDSIVAVFSEPRAALECAANLPDLKVAVITGDFTPDPSFARTRPKLGDFACPIVEQAHGWLRESCPGNLRVCEETSKSLEGDFQLVPHRAGFLEVAPPKPEVSPPAEPEVVETPVAPVRERPPVMLNRPMPKPKPEAPAPPPRRAPRKGPLIGAALLLGALAWGLAQPGRVQLICIPDRVEVQIDQTSPLAYESGKPLPLGLGPHRIMVNAAGYVPWRGKVWMNPMGKLTMNISLKKLPGKKPK